MSVITDALKAAQRERARRQSNGGPSNAAPLLVPLRSSPDSSPQRRRLFILVSVGVGLVAFSFGMKLWLQTLPKRATLPAVPAITSTILAEALADSTRAAPSAAAQDSSAAQTTQPIATHMQDASDVREPAIAVADAPRSDTTAVLQGVPRGEPSADSSAFARHAPRPGRLRITVENARYPLASQLFADAVAAHRAGNVTTARRLYDSVLVLTPKDADALNNLAVLLSAQREYSRALELLRRATVIAPRNPGAWNNIGTVYHAQGMHNDAIAAFRRALSLEPQHAAAKVGLAQQYLAINALEDARRLLEDVIANEPALAEAHYTLGQVFELAGDRAGAVRSYEQFLRVAPIRLSNHLELVRRRIDVLSRGR